MFPVLNKYVASRLKSSNYISLAQLEEETGTKLSDSTKQNDQPTQREANKQPSEKTRSLEVSEPTAASTGEQVKKPTGAEAHESLKQSLLNRKGSLLKKFVNS